MFSDTELYLDYIPSENLLDSWASLPSGLTYVSEPEETAIEHQRDYGARCHSFSSKYNTTHVVFSCVPDSSSFRAKQEPRNTVIVPSVDCEVRVKPEPVDDDYALGNYYATNLMHTSCTLFLHRVCATWYRVTKNDM